MRILSVVPVMAVSAPLALAACGYGGERGSLPADREGANYLPADPAPPPHRRETRPFERRDDLPGGTDARGLTR
jgi:hypothetical protein